MSRRAAGRAAPEWDVPAAPVSADQLDQRLRDGAGRAGLVQVVIDHDYPGVGRCPGCGWVGLATRRDCPSRVVALAVLHRTPLPQWLAHLAGEVPGVRVRETPHSREERRHAEDELPGLFDAPARQPDQSR